MKATKGKEKLAPSRLCEIKAPQAIFFPTEVLQMGDYVANDARETDSEDGATWEKQEGADLVWMGVFNTASESAKGGEIRGNEKKNEMAH